MARQSAQIEQPSMSQGEFFALKGYSATDDVSRHFTVHNFERNGDHIVFIIDGVHAETMQAF